MSGLSSNAEELARAFVPLAVLGASLLGSLHCLGMCGGLLAVVGKSPRSVAGYHLGRLLGYCGLGALAGLLGERVLSTATTGAWAWVAGLFIGLSFIWLGLRVWMERPIHFAMPASIRGIYLSLMTRLSGHAFGTGLASVLLPCGWLHGFVLGAVATRSPLQGAAFLFLFWLGTVPALTAAPLVIQRMLKPIALRAPRVSGSLLVLAGLVALGYKLAPLAQPVSAGHGPSCPLHRSAGP